MRAGRDIDRKERENARKEGRAAAPSATEYTKQQLESPRRATQFLMTNCKKRGGPSKRGSSSALDAPKPGKVSRTWDFRAGTQNLSKIDGNQTVTGDVDESWEESPAKRTAAVRIPFQPTMGWYGFRAAAVQFGARCILGRRRGSG
jgi:hypothetical protein